MTKKMNLDEVVFCPLLRDFRVFCLGDYYLESIFRAVFRAKAIVFEVNFPREFCALCVGVQLQTIEPIS